VFVATDDKKIKKHCLETNMQVLMTSDQCLTGTDRVYEASRQIQADLIINVQGDEPLVRPEDIVSVIDKYKENPDFVCCGMCPIKEEEEFRSPTVPKVVVDSKNKLLYMSRAAIPTNKKLELVTAMKQVCIYAFPTEALELYGKCDKKTDLEKIEDIEILRFFELGYKVKMVEVSGDSIAVDVPEDVDKVVAAMKERNLS